MMVFINLFYKTSYRHYSRNSGVTLTEVLVALGISSIVFIAAYAMFSQSIKQFTDGINQLESQRNGRRVIAYFRKKISSAVSGIKTVNLGEKAPAGLSSGLEFNLIADEKASNRSGNFYNTVTETYYLQDGKVMLKTSGGKLVKVFDSVKTLYFKIFTVEKNGKNIPIVLVQVTTFAANQKATYESMITPVFINSFKAGEGAVIPIFNSYASDAVN